MRSLVAAIRFLSRFPIPAIHGTTEDLARSICWFPVVGLLIGGFLALLWHIGTLISPWVGALLGLWAWVWSSGALHLDGLGDVTDAAGAAHKGPERIHAVLKDPHIGSFGVIAICLQLLSKLVLLHELAYRGTGIILTLALIPAVARLGPLVWAHSLRPMHEGLGSLFSAAVTPRLLVFWGILWMAATWLQPAFVMTPAIILLWHHHLRKTFKGINGDGFGAGIEIMETLLLLAAISFPLG